MGFIWNNDKTVILGSIVEYLLSNEDMDVGL